MSVAYENAVANGEYVALNGERYYKISNSHLMAEFFMSIVGSSDHWMFVSSTGALTCGRRNADNALFPYAADDQISALQHMTGPTTHIRVSSFDSEEQFASWQPFAAHTPLDKGLYRNLYKTPLGTKVVFEETNENLGLSFRYRWAFSERFGFVRSCHLENIGSANCRFNLLDGLSNVLPYGVNSDFMMRFSNLANAYRKNELLQESGLALFLLSSIPSDRAEPSEGLRTTTVWQTGLSPDATLLSRNQLPKFCTEGTTEEEIDVRGKPGAFLVQQAAELAPGNSMQWHVVAELAQDHCDVVELSKWIQESDDPATAIEQDLQASDRNFRRILASADALQCGENDRRCDRHQSNTVFNVMRGGIPLDNYAIDADDFVQHVGKFNRCVQEKHAALLGELPAKLTRAQLTTAAGQTGDADLQRLAMEYLPLAFSRRHGDPTRPWNRFSIDLRSEDGRTNLNYQGNWRDIFQNWEALAVSFPQFTTSMISRFVNATTADGYNPYRVTKDGFEWEEPTPEDPWANIGYWGDHQIIYLLRLLETSERIAPDELSRYLNARLFVHANVPYRIKPFADIKRDPQDTIAFDANLASLIAERVAEVGADGKLVRNTAGEIQRVTLLEKLLTLSLAKLSNFVPDGGIWLNTQRPEWNDANNALVGSGLSMVTACYLHRWFGFIETLLAKSQDGTFDVSSELAELFVRVSDVLQTGLKQLSSAMKPAARAKMVEALSEAGSDYRCQLYAQGLGGQTRQLTMDQVLQFARASRLHLVSTIKNNRRSDGLYHSYNLIRWTSEGVGVEHLYEMLEGQVAVLSAGVLSPSESVELLDALRCSPLYRENQLTYMLYPDRQLPRFTDKNQLSDQQVASSPLLQQLLADKNSRIVRRDVFGDVHFNGDFRNSADLRAALRNLPQVYQEKVAAETETLAEVFEDVFEHRQFTGRSGTFFAYEGLGSIYWHMVSKLGLAVAENFFDAVERSAEAGVLAALRGHYQAIREGIGAEKSPADYGAFPSDPYSHTPENAGVKQPGMTGQVKEDLLARFQEVGVHVEGGRLSFRLELFDKDELLQEAGEFSYYTPAGTPRTLTIPEGGFAFTLCQVPVVYTAADRDEIRIRFESGDQQTLAGRSIDAATTAKLFARGGEIQRIECQFENLR